MDYSYDNSPIYIQNLLCSVYGTIEKNKRFSKEFFAYLDWLEESQYWSKQEIYDYKLRNCRKFTSMPILRYLIIREKYKKAGLSLNSIQEFQKIPIKFPF